MDKMKYVPFCIQGMESSKRAGGVKRKEGRNRILVLEGIPFVESSPTEIGLQD